MRRQKWSIISNRRMNITFNYQRVMLNRLRKQRQRDRIAKAIVNEQTRLENAIRAYVELFNKRPYVFFGMPAIKKSLEVLQNINDQVECVPGMNQDSIDYLIHRGTVTNASELQEAVKMDHVCAKYKNNYRSIDNFLKSNVVVMDLDNDHTDDPDEWITAEKLEELLPDISYAVAPSRNHMVAKNGKAARPKYHVYFEIEEMTDAAAYAALKAAIHNAYPFFDGNALDAARFIFGADSGEAVWHEGWTTIDEEVVVELPDEETASGSGPILEGNRNNAMSRFAGRVLKRYGNTEKAHDAFMEHAQKCDPPLSDEELAIIWASAIRFFNKKVVGQDGYVPPEEYNQDFDGVSLEPEDFSDIGEAKVLAREYKDELIYSDATSFLRYDGTCWRENKQDAVGAVEEFLDMQLVDARDELNRCIEVLGSWELAAFM